MENEANIQEIENEYAEYENTENQEQINETIEENIVVDNTINIQSEKLEQIHQDLGIICSFLIAFVLVILLHYAYKFFNMFF